MAKCKVDKLKEWWFDKKACWQNHKPKNCQVEEMTSASWLKGKLTKRQDDKKASWQIGKLKKTADR